MLKEIPKKTCSVNGCNADRVTGDLLFCDKCRKKWERVCIKEGILETQISEHDLNGLLKEFQKEGLKWVV